MHTPWTRGGYDRVVTLQSRFLEAELSEKSIQTYEERLAALESNVPLPGAGASTDDLLAFREALRPVIRAAPMGTALPTRAAAWHHLVGVVGLDPHDAKRYLPSVRKQDAKTRRDPTPSERAALRLALVGEPPIVPPTSRARQAILLLAETGLRLSEVLGLRWVDVEEIPAEQCYRLTVEAKRGKMISAFAVGLSAAMLAALRRAAGDMAVGYVFPGEAGGPMHRNAIRNELKRIEERHEELDGLHPHLLRHWYAFDALNAGVELIDLQAALGHGSPETTVIYARPGQSRRIAAARLAQAAMWRPR